MKNRDLGCIDGKLLVFFFSFSSDTLFCVCIFECILLSTYKILNKKKMCLCCCMHRKYRPWGEKSQSINFMRESQQEKKIEIKYLMIESSPNPCFLITTPFHTHTHIYFYPQIHNIHKRLFHQICSHSPFSVIKMNCWCASVQLHKCAKSDSALPISKRMPSVRRMRLSLMYSHRVLCWQGSATLNWSWTWHMSKHYKGESAKVDITLMLEWFLHQSLVKSLYSNFTLDVVCFVSFCLFSCLSAHVNHNTNYKWIQHLSLYA